MYQKRVYPLLLVVSIPLICWAMIGETGVPAVLVLCVLGAVLAAAAAFGDAWPRPLQRATVVAITVLIVLGLVTAKTHSSDLLTTLPFIFALPAAASLRRQGTEQSGEDRSGDQRPRHDPSDGRLPSSV